MASDVPKRPMQINVSMPAYEWLKSEGRRQERSVNWLINKFIEEARAKSEPCSPSTKEPQR